MLSLKSTCTCIIDTHSDKRILEVKQFVHVIVHFFVSIEQFPSSNKSFFGTISSSPTCVSGRKAAFLKSLRLYNGRSNSWTLCLGL